MFVLTLEIRGLNPFDRDLLLTKFELIKDKLYENIILDYSYVKSSPNFIRLVANFQHDDISNALYLYDMLNKIEFEKTSYERCICNPTFSLSLNNHIEEYG